MLRLMNILEKGVNPDQDINLSNFPRSQRAL